MPLDLFATTLIAACSLGLVSTEYPSETDESEAPRSAEEPSSTDSTQESPPTAGRSSDLSEERAGSGAPTSEMRVRFGIQNGVGVMLGHWKSYGRALNFIYAAKELRLGAQLDDHISIYVQPQLGLYLPLGNDDLYGIGALVGGTLAGDLTLQDRYFFGVGAGVAMLNRPAAGQILLRLGMYPLAHRDSNSPRRRAMVVSIDARAYLLGQDRFFIAPGLSLGYEAF